jgi:GNAT superfamily N-acetyltransferase
MSTEPYTITLQCGTVVTVLFGEATAQQQQECDKLAASAWGSYLDEDEILAREAHLRSQNLACDDGGRTWCLYRKDYQDQILSTCKTLRREFFLRDAESVHEMRGYCITSVITAQTYRGLGLASYMLGNVAEWLDGPGNASVSRLYSGMPHSYEAIVLAISTWIQDTPRSDSGVEACSLADADIGELCTEYHQHLTRTGTEMEQSKLHVVPTVDMVRYQHALSDYMGDRWHYEAPRVRGAAYKRAWLCWYHDSRGRCLRIQHIHSPIGDADGKGEAMMALFMHAVREANEWNFTTISTWDLGADVRTTLEALARIGTFTNSVREIHQSQSISLR